MNDTHPKWSVVIPTFNRKDLLRNALSSILSSASAEVEVIVVDDGSTDGTVEMVTAEFRQVELHVQENAGPGAARNRGIEEASGDWVAFLDSDDLWFPWTIAVYESVIDRADIGFIFGKPERFRLESELDEVGAIDGQIEFERFGDYYVSGHEWRWWGASSFVVKRELLNEIRFCAESINGEDADFIMKLGAGHPLAQITSPATFAYREHEGNVMKVGAKTIAGAFNLVKTEQAGNYPGGDARRKERRRILGRHLRPVILDCLKGGARKEGVSLFRRTIGWHVAERRWRFLMGSLLAWAGLMR